MRIDAKDRIPDEEYRLVDGVTVITTSLPTVLCCTRKLDHPINQDENGTVVADGTNVWTGTHGAGTRQFATCSNWTSSSSSGRGVRGIATGATANSRWTASGQAQDCSFSRKLYCFEQ